MSKIRQFLFKVNTSKLDDNDKLSKQIDNVTTRIASKLNIRKSVIDLDFGYLDEDFAINKCTLRILFSEIEYETLERLDH
jgi:hypothetical protein